MFHPVHTFISKEVTDFEAIDLHQNIYVDGKLVYELPRLKEIQGYVKDNLLSLWDEYKRTLNPAEYPVDLSEKCWNNKMENINDIMEKVAKMKK